MTDPIRTDGAGGLSAAMARFAARTPAAALPAAARHQVRLSMLDWCAVGLAGCEENVSRIVRDMLAEDGGAARSTVLGLRARLPARAAALANGTTAHALDYDDTQFDFVGHPSAPVVAAALALAEARGSAGSELIDAVLIGVETTCRIGRWLGRAHYEHGFHQTATSGSFGAAAACARLLRLDEERTRHALGIASTRAAGLKSQFGTMGKPFHAGLAAANGLDAARLAAGGFVSRPDGLECEQGFARTHAGEMGDWSEALAGLGSEFRFQKVQYKYHACCHGTHAALEALLALREHVNQGAGGVRRVILRVNPRWLKVCNIQSPRTGLEAKFSYRFTAALALAGIDTGSLATFDDALCERADLAALRDKVEVQTDAAIADTAAEVRLETATGTFDERRDLDAAVSQDEQQAKLLAKANSLLGAARGMALWEAIAGLDKRPASSLGEVLAQVGSN